MTSSLATSIITLVLATQLLIAVAIPPYLFDGYGEDFPVANDGLGVGGGDVSMDRILQGLNKRSCIRRGSRCDQRPDDCCSGGACRCNLWGGNCQCQRMGIFQKWG